MATLLISADAPEGVDISFCLYAIDSENLDMIKARRAAFAALKASDPTLTSITFYGGATFHSYSSITAGGPLAGALDDGDWIEVAADQASALDELEEARVDAVRMVFDEDSFYFAASEHYCGGSVASRSILYKDVL